MTREEAKHRLLDIERCTPIHTREDAKDCEALKMAIEALEQETSGDVVSRQIEQKCDRINSIASVLPYTAHREIQELLCEIMDLPSVEQEPKWIPISERLPEDEQEILFSTKTGRVHSGKYHDDDSANQWYSHRDKCRAWNNVVSAWMPLPEPYKTESEESDEVSD